MKRSREDKTGFLILIVCVCIAAGCFGVYGIRAKEVPRIAVIVKSTESDFWRAVFAGANAAATEYNVRLSTNGPVSEEDYEAQNALIYEAIRDKVDAIVFSASDFFANAAAIDEAAKAGIRIVSIDSEVNSNAVSCRMGTNDYEAGRMAGQAALLSKEKKLYVGIVNSLGKSANGQQREAGFLDRVTKDPRVTVVKTINVESMTEKARAGTGKMLEEHPEINVVAAFNEWTSLGVGWAVRDLSLQEKTEVVAFDSNIVSVGMLETGEVDALIVQNPYAMGYLGVEAAYQLVNGKKPAKEKVDTETTLVTRENMFSEECQKILFRLAENN